MDIAILISKFLEDKAHIRDFENDCVNIIDNQIVSWTFTNIPCPTAEELAALAPLVEAKMSQEAINVEARKYLADTDWLIVRELESGIQCPQEIKLARAAARARVVPV